MNKELEEAAAAAQRLHGFQSYDLEHKGFDYVFKKGALWLLEQAKKRTIHVGMADSGNRAVPIEFLEELCKGEAMLQLREEQNFYAPSAIGKTIISFPTYEIKKENSQVFTDSELKSFAEEVWLVSQYEAGKRTFADYWELRLTAKGPR